MNNTVRYKSSICMKMIFLIVLDGLFLLMLGVFIQLFSFFLITSFSRWHLHVGEGYLRRFLWNFRHFYLGCAHYFENYSHWNYFYIDYYLSFFVFLVGDFKAPFLIHLLHHVRNQEAHTDLVQSYYWANLNHFFYQDFFCQQAMVSSLLPMDTTYFPF